MNIKLKKNPYLSVIVEQVNLNNESKIFNYAKESLQFKYVDVSFQKFKEKYSAKGWLGRKIIALPAAICSGVVKVTYHLAKALFIGFFTIFSSNKKSFKGQLFHIGRDFQGSFGWLISLFNDRYGQYHIQESGFHKTCYNYFFTDAVHFQQPNNPKNPPSSNPNNPSKQPSDPVIPLTDPPVNPPEKHTDNQKYQENFLESDLDTEFSQIGSLWGMKQREDLYIPLAEKYLNIGCLDKAHETANKLYSSKEGNPLRIKIANAYFDNGNLDKAHETVNSLYRSKEEDTLRIKIANAYFNNSNKEQAIRVVDKVNFDTIAKEMFLVQVAESYYAEKNLKEVHKLIDKLNHNLETEKTLIIKIANDYFKKGEKEKAIKVTDKITSWDINEKEAFLTQIAESYCAEDGLEQVLRMIDNLRCNLETKQLLIIKIANAYFQKEDRERSIQVINKLCISSRDKKAVFLVQIAESYYDEGNLEEALAIIGNCYSCKEKKETLLLKIANTYLSHGDRDKAFENAYKISYEFEGRSIFLIQLAQLYFSEKNDAKVIEILEDIAHGSLKHKIIEDGDRSLYYDVIRKHVPSAAVDDFFTNFARDCFIQTKSYFVNKDTQAILHETVRKSTDNSTLQEFFNIQIKPKNETRNAP